MNKHTCQLGNTDNGVSVWHATFLCGVLATLFVWGCVGNPRISDAYVQSISASEMAPHLDRFEKRLILVDVRTPTQFTTNHIPGSINIPIQDLKEGDGRLMGVEKIVVYGSGSDDVRGRAAVKKLLHEGYTNTVYLRGGLAEWRHYQKINQ